MSYRTNGDTIRVVGTGNRIDFYRNGVSYGYILETFNQTATKHGLYANQVFQPNLRWDDFSLTTPAERHPLKMWDGTTWQTVACLTPA